MKQQIKELEQDKRQRLRYLCKVAEQKQREINNLILPAAAEARQISEMLETWATSDSLTHEIKYNKYGKCN